VIRLYVEILAQSSAAFTLTYNFQGSRILGASRGHLSDSVIFLYYLSVLAVTLTIAEIREAMYDLEKSCTTDKPQTVVKKKSKLHCASACSGQVECRELNFDETTKDCSLYKHKALFFAAVPGCVRYKVIF